MIGIHAGFVPVDALGDDSGMIPGLADAEAEPVELRREEPGRGEDIAVARGGPRRHLPAPAP